MNTASHIAAQDILHTTMVLGRKLVAQVTDEDTLQYVLRETTSAGLKAAVESRLRALAKSPPAKPAPRPAKMSEARVVVAPVEAPRRRRAPVPAPTPSPFDHTCPMCKKVARNEEQVVKMFGYRNMKRFVKSTQLEVIDRRVQSFCKKCRSKKAPAGVKTLLRKPAAEAE